MGQKPLGYLLSNVATTISFSKKSYTIITFVRQSVRPLTAATFGDRLSPRARAHCHKSQINTIRSNDNNFLIRL